VTLVASGEKSRITLVRDRQKVSTKHKKELGGSFRLILYSSVIGNSLPVTLIFLE
jgi:hypothetical protein